MIILGIDPGTAITGYGVIKKSKNSLKCLDYGCIKTKSGLPAGERLKIISSQLNKIIEKHEPEAISVENIFFFKNAKTAIPVSQAKGVVLLCAAQKKIPTYEFTPPQIKMAVTGYGRAEKKQMQKMVQKTLNLKDIPKSDDAADALAAAISCALSLGKKEA
ncbi:MAG: crossover junction endodeoxyribonuclease RuvC [Candidatus Nealsonbacteria bacterium]|nr:crossover junction endodeoxyribonuclease RuvC [Candidatus Nealsonbacteria bacterium]